MPADETPAPPAESSAQAAGSELPIA